MTTTCTIVPLKSFNHSKTRLAPVLSAAERATIARLMALDVLRTLTAAPDVDRVLIVGQTVDHAQLAAELNCDFMDDDPDLDVSGNVARAAELVAAAGTETLLYLPADLPLLTVRDISTLFEMHSGGITISRAQRDNGTNALLASPPAAASFSFGSDSADRHYAAARAAGLPVRVLDIAAFARDIDEPRDLEWLCRHCRTGATAEYLHRSGFAGRFRLATGAAC
ncbi:MAG TPA: 2-phospho-L-lactate guanylyltransferase, partial [Woeseiaceae bacterium]|nr:2-phospho-L-lactate guanylyltransferase [Woeseiaceae bacterium]